uniref:Tr-type G domain-containing protein n=1 Tax=Trichobilharzia regenti TaxID=157069 RepID=A0AA85KP28_TRIRE|nr:unnamed protein product [Trichobilharzia regenti]
MNSRRTVLSSLTKRVSQIRNVCILAHVDHGKTTMADALLATNGIVSSRQSGKLRYMDNTEAEQERGITMKSSVIGLVFNRTISPSDKNSENYYLINLVDSPGHVDFSSEVSTAVRLCDGAIIVIDVVEGVCPQTRTVLRQAWDERSTLLLVLNKVDRLILELKMTPLQAYETMCRAIEQVNSVLAEMYSADVMRQRNSLWETSFSNQNSSSAINNDTTAYDWSTGLEKADDSNLYFSPEKGNVVFCSSVDSWGFRVDQFSKTWSERLSIPCSVLQKSLWGDFYLTATAAAAAATTGASSTELMNKMTVKTGAKQKQKKPIFVQLVLEPLWNAYQTLLLDDKRDKVFVMAEKIGVKLDQRVIRNVDSRGVLRALLSAWLPLGYTLMQAITDICPSPSKAVSADRAVHMLYGDTVLCDLPPLLTADSPISIDQTSRVPINSIYSSSGASLALQACNSSAESPTIIFVAKVFWTDKLRPTSNACDRPIPPEDIKSENTGHISTVQSCDPENSDINHPCVVPQPSLCCNASARQVNNTSLRSPLVSCNPFADTDFVALARVFSGTVYPGQKLFVLGPKFDGRKVPSYLLDSDPENFPLGPVRLRKEEEEEQNLGLSSTSHHNNSFDDLGKASSVNSGSFSISRSGSVGGGSSEFRLSGPRYLRHVYVASIVRVLQLLGSQSDMVEIVDPVPAGNIVGLTGPDLIACLPKSGLLVSRLSLVASMASKTDNSETEIAPVLPLAGLAVWHGAPVISVAVEPASAANPEDVYRLERGLRLLDRADPCAEVTITASGEYIIRAAGEIHLQKCIEDLVKYFAPDVELQISPFVVPFRETIIDTCSTLNSPSITVLSKLSYEKARAQYESILQKRNLTSELNINQLEKLNLNSPPLPQQPLTTSPIKTTAITTTVNIDNKTNDSLKLSNTTTTTNSIMTSAHHHLQGIPNFANCDITDFPISVFQLPHSKPRTRILIRVTAHPMPSELLNWIEHRGSSKVSHLIRAFKSKASNYSKLLSEFEQQLLSVCSELTSKCSPACSINWKHITSSLLAFGPNQIGPNLLISHLSSDTFPLCTAWGKKLTASSPSTSTSSNDKFSDSDVKKTYSLPLVSYGKALLRGFQLASLKGPLCAEPMYGVVFVLEEIVTEYLTALKLPDKTDTADTSQDKTQQSDPSCLLSLTTDGNQTSPPPAATLPTSRDSVDNPVCTTTTTTTAISSAKRRRKSKRLTSISWLNDYEDDDDDIANTCHSSDNSEDETDENYDNEPNDDWRSNSSSSEDEEDIVEDYQSDVENTNAVSLQNAKPEAYFDTTKEIPYWQQRQDISWLHDISPGLLTSAMTRACITAFQSCSCQRLMIAVYDLELQARSDVLGRMFGVLRRRYGRVVGEDFREGENIFVINARLPVIESFGLADEIRKRTSGIVSLPQLRPGGWELLDIDPLQQQQKETVSSTDTKEDTSSSSSSYRLKTTTGKYSSRSKVNVVNTGGSVAIGDDGTGENVEESTSQFSRVQRYIREVRLRKGLPLNEQLVLNADKQRTLKKNK